MKLKKDELVEKAKAAELQLLEPRLISSLAYLSELKNDAPRPHWWHGYD